MGIGENKQVFELLSQARELTWKNCGKNIDFYLPGMVTLNKEKGEYPAISITGESCELNCGHCGGKLLKSMIPASNPEALIARCIMVKEAGNQGCLISGGCLKNGRLPWEPFIEAIAEVKRRTNLNISVHSGLLDREIAQGFKDAGVDQVLIDVIGDEETFKTVYQVNAGIEAIRNSLKAFKETGIPMAPHITIGLNHGVIRGEFEALKMMAEFTPEILVFVVLMPLPGTPMQDVLPPDPLDTAEIIATARIAMPQTRITLGCARPRGKISEKIETLAIDAGVNRIALWSDAAIKRAQEYGLQINFHKTCCSVSEVRRMA